MKRKNATVAEVVVIFVASTLFWLVAIHPAVRSRVRASGEIEEARCQISERVERLGSLATSRAAEELRADIAELESRLEAASSAERISRELRAVASTSGLFVVSDEAWSVASDVGGRTKELTVLGPFESILDWFDRIEASPRRILIDAIEVRPAAVREPDTESAREVEATVRLSLGFEWATSVASNESTDPSASGGGDE